MADVEYEVGKLYERVVSDVAGLDYHKVAFRVLRESTKEAYIEYAVEIAKQQGTEPALGMYLDNAKFYEVLMD